MEARLGLVIHIILDQIPSLRSIKVNNMDVRQQV